jgi:hypothetical protein
MNDNQVLMRRQADWQKGRARLSWPDKMRMAEILSRTLRQFRSLNSEQPGKSRPRSDNRVP